MCNHMCSSKWHELTYPFPNFNGCTRMYSTSQKYAHGFVVLCFVVVTQSFIMNSHEVFIHIHQGCFAGTGAIVRLPQCQWSKPDGYRKISQCITTTKHSKTKTVCIFLGIYCKYSNQLQHNANVQKKLIAIISYVLLVDFTHYHQGPFVGTESIMRLPQWQRINNKQCE